MILYVLRPFANASVRTAHNGDSHLSELIIFISGLSSIVSSVFANSEPVRGFEEGALQMCFADLRQHPIKSSFPDEVTGGVLSKVKRKLGLLEVSKMPQCAPYFSENTVKCHRVFGDFQVSLHKRQVEEHYTISIFRLYNLQINAETKKMPL
ncbi:uncharacterized protein LOC143242898 isoform X2 [Tachypleus tridentatus]|uniref:uncharacterized protein LOC143242898 isoform X2 n=2 Tax=Tachypleus tridentatus TaxID=6853 RepID=UPI003FD40CC0